MPAVASPSTKRICLLRGNISLGQEKMSTGRFSGHKAKNERERREIQHHIAANSTYHAEEWPHTWQWLQRTDRFAVQHLREWANCSLLSTRVIIIIIILKEAFQGSDSQGLKVYYTIVHQFIGVHTSIRKYFKGSYQAVDPGSDMRIILNGWY